MIRVEQIIHQEIDTSIKERVIFHKGEVYTYFDEGLTRYVFANADKTKVIKILQASKSFDYNKEEFEIYHNASDEVKAEFAKTTLECDGWLVEQEFCNPIKFDSRRLTIPQMKFAASCRNEVGWNSDGKLVCFDLNEYKKW